VLTSAFRARATTGDPLRLGLLFDRRTPGSGSRIGGCGARSDLQALRGLSNASRRVVPVAPSLITGDETRAALILRGGHPSFVGPDGSVLTKRTVTERSGLVKAEPKRTQDPKRNKNARIEEDY
jgi:hypothetical protein